MSASPEDRSLRRVALTLICGVQVVIVLACIAHGGRRVWKDTQRDVWPARQAVPNFEWIERRVRPLGEVGHIDLTEGQTSNEHRLALVQNALVPAVLHLEERDVSVVTFTREMDRERVRAELRARGFPHVQMRPKSDVGLAGRNALPAPREAFPTPSNREKFGGLALLSVTALLFGLAAARRGGQQAFFAMLLVAPFTLGLAFAAGEAASSPTLVTLAMWFALNAIGAAVFGRWPVATAAGDCRTAGDERGARILLAAMLVVVALGVVQVVTNYGIHPDGGIDAFRMFNLRARFILRATEFAAPFSTDGYLLTTHADYPPLIPFAVAGVYQLVGGVSALGPIWVQSCAWIGGAGLIVFWTLRTAGRLPALTMLALLVCNPFWVRSLTEQVCDVPLALLVGAALIALRGALTPDAPKAHASPGRSAALACGVLSGLALLVKNEASMMALVLGLVVAGWGLLRWRERRGRLAWIALGFAPFLALLVAFETISPVNDLVTLSRWSSASWSRATTIAAAFRSVVLDPMLFKGAFALAAAAALIVAPSRIRDTLRGASGRRAWEACVSIALLGMITALFLVYLRTPHDLAWHLETSVNRVFAQLLPAAALLAISLVGTRPGGRAGTDLKM